MFYFVNMRTGESRWLDDDCDSLKIGGDVWERKGQACSGGHRMPVESSPRHDAWFKSEATQAKLKSGEYEVLSKSDDVNHL